MASESFWDPHALENRDEIAGDVYENYELLHSELNSLYEEFDKLTKKYPNNQVSNLALQNVNLIIEDAKALLSGDRYVDRIVPFVAAGENPINSDVLLVLATLRQALQRLRETWYRVWEQTGIF